MDETGFIKTCGEKYCCSFQLLFAEVVWFCFLFSAVFKPGDVYCGHVIVLTLFLLLKTLVWFLQRVQDHYHVGTPPPLPVTVGVPARPVPNMPIWSEHIYFVGSSLLSESECHSFVPFTAQWFSFWTSSVEDVMVVTTMSDQSPKPQFPQILLLICFSVQSCIESK